MDLYWVQTLASAKFKDGQWLLPDPHGVKAKAKQELNATIAELHRQLIAVVGTYNTHKRHKKQLRILPIYDTQGRTMIGFVLLLASLQLRLELQDSQLEATMETMQGFRKVQEKIHEFVPRIDGLGGLSWIMDQKSIMTKEMILKQLLHDLCSSALSSE